MAPKETVLLALADKLEFREGERTFLIWQPKNAIVFQRMLQNMF